MPVYNAALYLEEAIQSVLDQTFTDYNFLIINDGSVDGSTEIIKSFDDPRIQYVEHEINKGLIATLNEGLVLAAGEYIIRMDADDVALPTRFEKQVAFMDINVDIAISGSYLAADNKAGVIEFPETSEECKVALLQNTVVGHPSAILRREAIINAGLKFNGTALHAEDYRFWADAASAGLKIANIPEKLVKYRLHENQVSSVWAARQHESVQQIRLWYARRYFGDIINDANIYLDLLEKNISKFAHFETAIRMMNAMKAENDKKQYFDNQLFNRFLDGLAKSAAFRIYVLCLDCNLRILLRSVFDKNFYLSTNFLQKGRFILRSFKNAFS